jgi:putative Holliday junction resolvase
VPSDFDQVLRFAAEREVDEIIVGLPISLSGRREAQANRVAEFIAGLAERTTLPITSVDERYSSVQAERMIRETGAKPSRDRARVDAAAAAVILQSFLDSRRPNA